MEPMDYTEPRQHAIETTDQNLQIIACAGSGKTRVVAAPVVNILEPALRRAGVAGVTVVPILGNPEYLDTEALRRFQWTGIRADGEKCHTKVVPCHTDLER